MFKIDNVYVEIYIFAVVLAFLYFAFTNLSLTQLTSIIIVLLLSVGIYMYVNNLSYDRENSLKYVENTLENDIKDRNEVNEKNFYIDKFPKKLKFLKQNEALIKIITNLRFTIKFSKSRYSDIILNMNKLIKIYIYILSDRYDVVQYIPMFTDIKDNIVELLYSLFMIVPSGMKHTYGLDPHKEIYRSIEDFIEYSDSMLNIIEKYAIIHKNEVYIPDNKYKPYNAIRSFYP